MIGRRDYGVLGHHLKLGIEYGIKSWYSDSMGEMRKVTLEAPEDLLEMAQAASGASMAETIRTALREFVNRAAWKRLMELEGKVQFECTWEELRGKDDE